MFLNLLKSLARSTSAQLASMPDFKVPPRQITPAEAKARRAAYKRRKAAKAARRRNRK